MLDSQGWKFALRIEHRSRIVLCISAAPVDLITELDTLRKATAARMGRDYYPIQDGHAEVRHRHCLGDYFPQESAALPVMEKAFEALRSAGWYDRSDAMIDYFDTAYYYEIEIGRWDKPLCLHR